MSVPPGRYAPGLSLITSQARLDALPVIGEDYRWRRLNEAIVRIHT
ncbi:MAG: hypothetical protein ACT4PN_16675 [Nitrospiraceae bacterium]